LTNRGQKKKADKFGGTHSNRLQTGRTNSTSFLCIYHAEPLCLNFTGSEPELVNDPGSELNFHKHSLVKAIDLSKSLSSDD
jgi:hypothetical protein